MSFHNLLSETNIEVFRVRNDPFLTFKALFKVCVTKICSNIKDVEVVEIISTSPLIWKLLTDVEKKLFDPTNHIITVYDIHLLIHKYLGHLKYNKIFN
jgi:hypothetical protein